MSQHERVKPEADKITISRTYYDMLVRQSQEIISRKSEAEQPGSRELITHWQPLPQPPTLPSAPEKSK